MSISVVVGLHSGCGNTAPQAQAVASGAASASGVLASGWLDSAADEVDDLHGLGGFLHAMAQTPADAGPRDVPPPADRRTAGRRARRVDHLRQARLVGAA
jgi:hypothetical protein